MRKIKVIRNSILAILLISILTSCNLNEDIMCVVYFNLLFK